MESVDRTWFLTPSSIADQNGTVEKAEKGETLFFKCGGLIRIEARNCRPDGPKRAKVSLNATLRIPGQGGHGSGTKPVTDSDFEPISFRRWSEPLPG